MEAKEVTHPIQEDVKSKTKNRSRKSPGFGAVLIASCGVVFAAHYLAIPLTPVVIAIAFGVVISGVAGSGKDGSNG